MDEKELYYEFISIVSERHPGLTLEEYIDSCVYILFYHYLCLKYDDKIDDNYKIGILVKMATRGKLHVDSFLHFMESASPFIHLACKDFQLSEFSYFKKLQNVKLLEKQKSYARFLRKLTKKIYAWNCPELLLKSYPSLFEKLMMEFAKLKKETYLSDDMHKLFSFFFRLEKKNHEKIMLPFFRYGILLQSMLEDSEVSEIYGCETNYDYIEMLTILCYMKNIPIDRIHLYEHEEWNLNASDKFNTCDASGIFMPEGVDGGTLLAESYEMPYPAEMLNLKSKGELPLLLSNLTFLNENGHMVAVFPSALLYREGREQIIRKYLVDDLNCIDTIMLLPENIFQATGQDEVLLYLTKGRKNTDIMFFDCSSTDSFDEDMFDKISQALKDRKTISNFCSCVDKKAIADNDYNLNLPRYIVHPEEDRKIDMASKLARIAEIDAELKEIDAKIRMYRSDLNLA